MFHVTNGKPPDRIQGNPLEHFILTSNTMCNIIVYSYSVHCIRALHDIADQILFHSFVFPSNCVENSEINCVR